MAVFPRDIIMKKFSLTMTLFAVLAGAAFAEEAMIKIGSGSTVGIYYSASSAVAKMCNNNRAEDNEYMITVASEGSLDNINNVLLGRVNFGLAQANLLDKASRGAGLWEGSPQKKLSAVFKLYTEDFTIVAAEDARIRTMSDLAGKRVNIGAPGSSDALYARDMLWLAGVRPSEMTILEEDQSRSEDLLADGKIDAYIYTVGHPTFSVREASSHKRKVELVPLDQSLVDFLVASNALVKATLIPIDFYPAIKNREPVPSVGVHAVLFTTEDTSEDVVYRMVKDVMENLDLFRRQHPAFRNLEAKQMGDVSFMPLHPGAKRYFKEAGLLP